MNAGRSPLSVTEVMRRGDRLQRLRNAGVREPYRFIRSDREMRRALYLQSQISGRPIGYVSFSLQCAWCDAKVESGQIACDEHRIAEARLQDEFYE